MHADVRKRQHSYGAAMRGCGHTFKYFGQIGPPTAYAMPCPPPLHCSFRAAGRARRTKSRRCIQRRSATKPERQGCHKACQHM